MRDTRGRDGKTGCYARMENKTLKIQIINLRCYTVVAGEPDVVVSAGAFGLESCSRR